MKIVLRILDGFIYLIFADVILSWLMPDKNQVPRSYVVKITEPLYAPIRELLSPVQSGRIDLSPLVVLLSIYAVQYGIRKLAGIR
jgi:uncharacterized protein YggT (Ycf19 family)